MKNIIHNLFSSVFCYGINKKIARLIFIFPLVISLVVITLIIVPSTRLFTYFWFISENGPVEIGTFVFFLVGGIYGLYFSHSILKLEKKYIVTFYSFFSICLIVLAMEEIAWGQWFFHFSTPDSWKDINVQGETTLHNLGAMQENNDVLRLIFGVGGLLGIILRKMKGFEKIGAPLILLSWFIIISFHAILDIVVDSYDYNQYRIITPIIRFNELIELLVAGASFLYLWLNSKLLRSTISI